MARNLTAETLLEGTRLLSIGTYPCRSGPSFDHATKPERREAANPGRPVVRW